MAERGLVIQPPFFCREKPMTEKTEKRSAKSLKTKEAPTAPAKPEFVVFRSSRKETHEFEIMGIRGVRGGDLRLSFGVPAADADKFAQHAHVISGRVSRVG